MNFLFLVDRVVKVQRFGHFILRVVLLTSNKYLVWDPTVSCVDESVRVKAVFPFLGKGGNVSADAFCF
ncbi:MAG: hypothetical protein ACKESB_00565 [Candidatus Hodgkinia cicadicola]